MMDGLSFDYLVSKEMTIVSGQVVPEEDYFILGHKNVYFGQGTRYPIYAIKASDVMGITGIQDEGILLPKESVLNFIGDNVVASDDPGNNRTNVTITCNAVMTPYTPGDTDDWAAPFPTNVQQALDRIAAYISLINPIP